MALYIVYIYNALRLVRDGQGLGPRPVWRGWGVRAGPRAAGRGGGPSAAHVSRTGGVSGCIDGYTFKFTYIFSIIVYSAAHVSGRGAGMYR